MYQTALKRSTNNATKRPWLTIFCWLSLGTAYFCGWFINQPNHLQILQQAYPDTTVTQLNEARGHQYQIVNNKQRRHISLGESSGYGGPILVAIEVNEKGQIINTKLLAHKETPGYINRFLQGRFFDQFKRKPINGSYQIGHNVDGVSGATLSSQGLASAIANGAHNASSFYNLEQNWASEPWRVGAKELIISLLFIAAILAKKVTRKWQTLYKRVLAFLSVVFIGYWFNSALSIAMISSLLLGYLPSPQQHLLWYIMLLGALGTIIVLGRNVYCDQLCPFHQIQRWLHKVSGVNLALFPKLRHNIKSICNCLLWLSLMLIFLSRTPAVGSYEPFSMLFSLDGVGVGWYLLPLSLFGALVVSDFWCKMLCPLGRFLNYNLELRSKALRQIRTQKKHYNTHKVTIGGMTSEYKNRSFNKKGKSQ